jgi:hypothetical protein
MTSSGIEPSAFRFVEYCLNQLGYSLSPLILHTCFIPNALIILSKQNYSYFVALYSLSRVFTFHDGTLRDLWPSLVQELHTSFVP